MQVERALQHLKSKPDDLERYIYLQDLCERNQTLFYATVMSDPARFVAIANDPTIADACLTYGHIYRRPQDMYLTMNMRGRFAEVLAHWPVNDIRFICISSGGRILGLGDIGANGAPIPIGSCNSIPPVRACLRVASCQSISTLEQLMPHCEPIRSIQGCVTSRRLQRR